MVVLEFSLEVEPKAKKRPKVYRWSTVNPSEEDEQILAGEMRAHPECPEEPYAGQIRLQLKFYMNPPKSTPQWKLPYMDEGYLRPNKSPDLDNYVKLVLDALNGILWEDDRYIVETNSAKFYTTKEPKIEIMMEQWDPPQYMKDAEMIIGGYKEQAELDEFFSYEDETGEDITDEE